MCVFPTFVYRLCLTRRLQVCLLLHVWRPFDVCYSLSDDFIEIYARVCQARSGLDLGPPPVRRSLGPRVLSVPSWDAARTRRRDVPHVALADATGKTTHRAGL